MPPPARPAGSNSYSLKGTHEWKVGNALNIHAVNLLPLAKLSELHFKMANNHSSIWEFILDGLPPSSTAIEKVELIFKALSTNTSIKQLSMRYSHVESDLASLFALALSLLLNRGELGIGIVLICSPCSPLSIRIIIIAMSII